MSSRSLAPYLLGALLLAGCRGDRSPTDPEPTPEHDPVLFVHGWNGSATNWDAMVGRFRTDGWRERDLFVWSYGSTLSNREIAQLVKERVDEILAATNAERVDIVTHSMGGLSSRYYLKVLGGRERVDAWVSLAGPNHGTRIALFCATTPCLEMRPGSDFLLELNAGDETPGEVRYATWWSACDEAIDPRESAVLAGAQNTETACLGHVQFLQDATVYEQVRAWIADGDP